MAHDMNPNWWIASDTFKIVIDNDNANPLFT